MADVSAAPRPGSVFSILWHYAILIVALAVTGLVIGLLIAHFQPTSYTAESRVFLSSQASFDAIDDGQNANDPSRYLDQQAALMTSTPLLLRAIALDDRDVDPVELRQSVDVIASAESDMLTVRASAADSTQAAALVDDIIAAYREYQASLVSAQLASIEKVSNADERRLAQQRAVVYGDGVELVEKAAVTEASSAIRNASVLGVVGLLLGSGLAFALNARRRSEGARTGRRGQLAAAQSPDGINSSEHRQPHRDGRTPYPASGHHPSGAADHDGAPVGAASNHGRQ